MKILAIGLGSAGCRLVDTLLLHDKRSGTARCVDGVAVDRDEQTLTALRHVPDRLKIFFSPLDPDKKTDLSRSITSDEIVAKLLTLDRGELDAVVIVCGLGGGMVDLVPALAREIRESMQERVFALATLPRTVEDDAVLSKAASDLEMLSGVVDGTILFDNDRLYERVQVYQAGKGRFSKPRTSRRKGPEREQPQEDPWLPVNQHISRRFGLLLRAGEITEEGQQESAEVVLDAGEILRTISGMGLITIGYAAEKIPDEPGGILRFLRKGGDTAVTRQRKAERVVELARKALNEEMSVACDLAAAQKALVLILGPSHELSMKGFMAVRKWIDQGISGPEMRSGDYPVENTRYIGIIIVLSGLHPVPRVHELEKVRNNLRKNTPPSDMSARDFPIEPSYLEQSKPQEMKRITLGVVSERVDPSVTRRPDEQPAAGDQDIGADLPPQPAFQEETKKNH